MYCGEIYGRRCEMQGSPYTLLLFKQEFEEDLPSFLVKAYAGESVDIECLLRIAWAMCRTYSDDILDYERWLEGFPADLFDITEGKAAFDVIDAAINAELFRQKKTLRERIKRWLRNKLI